jgi:hypothetical protein
VSGHVERHTLAVNHRQVEFGSDDLLYIEDAFDDLRAIRRDDRTSAAQDEFVRRVCHLRRAREFSRQISDPH